MRLIYADDREVLGVRYSEIEALFFAKFEVEDALCTPFPTLSLFDIQTYGRQLSHEEIVDGVETGDILLVEDDPFSALSQDTLNEYSHITGRGWTGSFHTPAVARLEGHVSGLSSRTVFVCLWPTSTIHRWHLWVVTNDVHDMSSTWGRTRMANRSNAR